MSALADRLHDEIRSGGPMPVSRFVERCLYDPDGGFYAEAGRAGRRGDFLTAVEVGPLFGAVLSRAIDQWWVARGSPPRFVVADYGAGPGTLARAVFAAEGECQQAGALQWVMIERSASQRSVHPVGPQLTSVADDDELTHVDVGFANELLDNLPFDVVAFRNGQWVERLVDGVDGRFVLCDGSPSPAPLGITADPVPEGVELPRPVGVDRWLADQRERFPDSALVLCDYMATTAELVGRNGGWLRTFRGHGSGPDWFAEPGANDITIDVPREHIEAHQPDEIIDQAAFLRRYGIDHLVEEGRRIWQDRAGVGDLAALRARSRISEAEALLDLDGMGSFQVAMWQPVDRRVR